MASSPTAGGGWRGWPFALGLAVRGLIAGVLVWAAFRAAVGFGYYATAVVLLALATAVAVDLARRAGLAERTLQNFADALAAGAIERPARKVVGFTDVAHAVNRAADRLEAERLAGQQRLDGLEALIDTVTAALFVLAGDGRIVLANRAAHNLAGEQADRLGRLAVFGPELGARLAALPPGAREVVRLTDGRAALASTAAYSLPGGVRRQLISLQTVSGELDAVELKAWRDLVRILAHEMMNSLTPIVSLAESLDRMLQGGEADAAEAASAAQVIARRGAGLMSFVDRYRKLADLPPPSLAPVRLSELAASMEQLFAPMLKGRGVELSSAVAPAGLTILADQELLEQAIVNLVKNAAEAVGEGGRIALACHLAGDGAVVISVADNGPGLPDDADNLFLPFFTTKAGGSGLGLSLARQVALAHHGRLLAQDTGAGATFSLTLPADSVVL
jgi:nitrogen fixation/metabolism regulation signal transduction histidine kinase